MRTLEQFLDTYAVSHQNPLNQVIHVICVPAIFFATLAMMWLVPVGRFIPSVPADIAPSINLATLFMPVAGIFYARLSLGSLVTGTIWTVLSVLLVLAIQHAHLPLLAIAATVWIAAWLGQFYGHHVEGAKPSFADDILFLLVGPLFVQQKLVRWATTGSMQAKPR